MAKKSRKDSLVIMIVDDEKDIRESIKEMLESDRDTVILAKDAAEALHLAKTEKPDIVFIDMMLPVLVGHDVFIRIKMMLPDVVGVLMTGYQEEMKELVHVAMNQGAHSCLYKPHDLPKAAGIVEEVRDKLRSKIKK